MAKQSPIPIEKNLESQRTHRARFVPTAMPTPGTPAPKEKVPNDRRMRLARLLRDGVRWRPACLQVGYSLSVANKGMKAYMNGSSGENRTRSVRRPGIMKDFEKLAAETNWKPEVLKKIATHRLATAVVEGQESGCAREIELLGKFREHDWFVTAANATSVGIFAVLADPDNGAMLDETLASMKDYRDGTEFSCAWCSEECRSAESLQVHALSCAKRPVAVQAIISPNSNGATQ